MREKQETGLTYQGKPRTCGFRISLTDVMTLVLGFTIGAAGYIRIGDIALFVPYVVGHFFLFCNVFRVRRRPELLWAGTFVINCSIWLLVGCIDVAGMLGSQIAVTLGVIVNELRSPSYHGICARAINPMIDDYLAGNGTVGVEDAEPYCVPHAGSGRRLDVERKVIIDALRMSIEGRSAEESAPPWLSWLIVCLCRQRARQTWLVHVHEEQLKDLDARQGVVPSLPDWSYRYHGMGLCLSGPNGERLDYDFHDEEGATIDTYFFTQRIVSLETRELPERMLHRWLPGEGCLRVALEELTRMRLLHHPSSRHVFTLCPELEALHLQASSADFTSPVSHARWMGNFGDEDDQGPLANHEWAGSYRQWVFDRLRDRESAAQIVEEVESNLEDSEFLRAAKELLLGNVDRATGPTISALGSLEANLAAEVVEVARRMDSRKHHPYAALKASQYLLKRGEFCDEALGLAKRFADVPNSPGYSGNPMGDELAILLWEYEPESALPYIRLALRSPVPAVVETMAVILGLIDAPWCSDEMIEALSDTESSGDPHCRRILARVLQKSASEKGREAGRQLCPPQPESSGYGYTIDEIMAMNLDADLEYQSGCLAETVDSIRGKTPGMK